MLLSNHLCLQRSLLLCTLHYVALNTSHCKSGIPVIFFMLLIFIFHLTPSFPLLSLLHLHLHLHCLLCSVLPLCGCPLVLQALAQAIKEAKEQHPDMSVTRVVVHKETELAEEED